MDNSDNIEIDVFFSQPAFFSGQVFRCNLEVRGPLQHSELVGIDYVTLQVCGAVSSSVPSIARALDDSKESLTSAHNVPGTQGKELPVGQDSKIFIVSESCVVCSDLCFTQDGETYWYGYECVLPPFLPPTFSGSSTKYAYYLQMVVQKRFATTLGSSSSRMVKPRMPIQLVGSYSSEMPIIQSLGCSVLPDPNSSGKHKSRKNASFGPIADALSQNYSLASHSTSKTHLGHVNGFVAAEPSAIGSAAVGDFLPDCDTNKQYTFDFQAHSWQGGSCYSQISLLRGLPAGKGILQRPMHAAPPSVIEVNLALWNVSRGIRKHGSSAVNSLLRTGVTRSGYEAPWRGVSTPVLESGMSSDSLMHGTNLSDEVSSFADLQFESFGREGLSVSRSQSLTDGVQSRRSKRRIVPIQCQGSLGHVPESDSIPNNTSLLRRAASSFLMEDDDDDIITHRKEKFRICSGNLEICVVELWNKPTKDDRCCYANVASCIPVILDFGTATATTYEVCIAVVREERPSQPEVRF
eukprot:GHVQ01012311.1.p1 GENE.GHVQ01012311.1~~GHVQ01012311.1.p1  ORF type:complete len:522 (+),score=41.91 GHVQ01012311.1:176-1741(+)